MELSAPTEGLPEEDGCPVCSLSRDISLLFITATRVCESDLELPSHTHARAHTPSGTENRESG